MFVVRSGRAWASSIMSVAVNIFDTVDLEDIHYTARKAIHVIKLAQA